MLAPEHGPRGVQGAGSRHIVRDAMDDYTRQAVHCPQQQLIRGPLLPGTAACTTSTHRFKHFAALHVYDLPEPMQELCSEVCAV